MCLADIDFAIDAIVAFGEFMFSEYQKKFHISEYFIGVELFEKSNNHSLRGSPNVDTRNVRVKILFYRSRPFAVN